MECEYCSGWHHIGCVGVSAEVYDLLREGGDQLHWFCRKCNDKAVDVLMLVSQLKEQQDNCKEPELTKNLRKVVQGEIKEGSHTKEIEKMSTVPPTAISKEEIQKEVNEAVQREKKKNRVVMNNLTRIEDTHEEVQGKVDNLLQKLTIPPTVQVKKLRDGRDKGNIAQKSKGTKGNSTVYQRVQLGRISRISRDRRADN